MKFLRATRTNGALVFINIEQITAIQHEDSERLSYTAIILRNGREIDVTESPEELLQSTDAIIIEL